VITIENLRYRSLFIDELQIPPGITSVIGRNGSGKTTFLKLLAGIALPDSGRILIDGVLPREAEIGWVNEFPDRNILFWNAFEEIAAPLRFRHLPCAVIRDRVESCMQSLGIGPLENRPIQQVSGGEKMLVALAAALVIRPQVLVLDEYDSHLDARRSMEIARLVRSSGARSVIHCTQDMEAAARGDSVIYIEDGRAICSGSPEDLFPALASTAFYPFSWRCRA
jgi:energy-coupling factor transport system ATP-binding protein